MGGRYKTCCKNIQLFTQSTEVQNKGGLIISCKISLNLAKSEKPHTIAEKIVISAIKDFIENVMKKDTGNILKSFTNEREFYKTIYWWNDLGNRKYGT